MPPENGKRDLAARNKLVEDNIRFLYSRVLALNHGIFNEDLLQAGAVALCLAADRFDPVKGSFLSFAGKYIDGYIRSYKNLDSVIRPPRNGCHFTYPQVDSLDEPIIYNDRELNVEEILPSDVNVEIDVIESVYYAKFLKRLTEKEQGILDLRMGGLTQKEISEIVGLSQAYVSRTLKRIGKKYLIYKWDGVKIGNDQK